MATQWTIRVRLGERELDRLIAWIEAQGDPYLPKPAVNILQSLYESRERIARHHAWVESLDQAIPFKD
jgi:hypothetical protein